jgi:hypothetical protein
MPPAETPIAALQRQLDAGRFEEAIATADAIIATNRRVFAAWLGRARGCASATSPTPTATSTKH